MRRPPDKEGQKTLSERDISSSNATLNTVFGHGGARQKSWMVGNTGPTARPVPCTNVSRNNIPQVPPAKKATLPVLPSPAPSDEPSPVLSHTSASGIQNGTVRRDSRQETRPAVSIVHAGPVQSTATAQNHRGNDSTTLREHSNTSSEVASNQAVESLPALQSLQSLPQTIISTEMPPLPSSVLLPMNQEQQAVTRMDTIVQIEDEESRPSVSQAQMSSPYPARQMSLNQGQTTGQTQQGQRPGSVQTSTSIPGFQSSNSLPSPGMHAVPSARPVTAASPPRKRQRTQVAPMISLKPRLHIIERQIEKTGGHMNLNTALERPRFQLLKDACNKEDSFYVALHQIFCCWDVDQSQVLNIPGCPNAQVLRVAFGYLSQLIRENDALAPMHKIFFANFPSPLQDLLQTSEAYRRTLAEVSLFLSKLAMNWTSLASDCSKRGYPPLVDELVERLGLLSPILQSVVFTASRRNLQIRDEEVGSRMETLFLKDRAGHQELAARYNTARPPSAREVQERNRALASEYLQLHGALLQHRQSSTPVNANPPTFSPVQHSISYQTNLINSSNSHPPQQGEWTQSMHSPNAGGNRQFPNSMPVQIQRPGENLANTPTIGHRPPSAGAQHVYTNTPSPTLLQGLTMHSPVQPNFPPPPVVRSNAPMQPQQNRSPQIGVQQNGLYYSSPTTQQLVDLAMQNQHAVQQQQQQRIHAQVPAQQHAHQWSQAQVAQQQQHINPNAQHVNPRQWSQAQLAQQQQQQQQQQQHQHQQQQQSLLRQQHYTAQLPHAVQQQHSRQQAQLQQISNRPALNLGNHAQPRRDSNPLLVSRNNITVTNNLHSGTSSPSAPIHHQAQAYDQTQFDVQTYIDKHPLERSLIPPSGYNHYAQQQPKNADITALHHAHLRSPRLIYADLPVSSMSQNDPATRYYQAVRGFVLAPTRISSSSPLSKFDFTIPSGDLALVPRDVKHSNGQVVSRHFRIGTLQYRLRCVKTDRSNVKCPIADWVVNDTVWPESASLAINKNPLEIRRKNHHGKDLPIDVTSYVASPISTSTNQITLSTLKARSKMKDFSYFIAVEIVEILQHRQILDFAYQNRIPAHQSLNKIKRSLTVPTDDGDDDFAMVVSDISIDLADPFMSTIFKIPVRGSSCLHRECFDLETFLLTRDSKPKRPEQPCMIDVWKCPLCDKDARPYSLQIDGFLESVRATLEEQGKLDVKAILVGADGNWRPKVEKRKATSGPGSDYSSDGDSAMRRASSMSTRGHQNPKKVVEVIDLD